MRIWEQYITKMESTLGSETVDRWLKTLRVLRYDACNLYLEAKDSFQKAWFEEHVRPHLSLLNNNNKEIEVHISLPSAKQSGQAVKGKKNPPKKREEALIFDDPDPYCQFDNFVSFEGNILAYKVLAELVGYDTETGKQIPSRIANIPFNPIYIYGPEGSGKSHLLMATASYLKARGVKVLYTRAETLITHLIQAMRSGIMEPIRGQCRHVDVLLVDDMQVFSKKKACQEEFFHTFNALHQDGKGIILSADVYPQALVDVEPRLVSRFEWGITVPAGEPKKEILPAILRNKAKALDFPLADVVEKYLCSSFSTGVAALSRAFETLVLRSHLHRDKGESVTLAKAQALLSDLVMEEEKSVLTPERVIEVVSAFYGVPVNEILGKSQSRDCAFPRQVAMHLLRSILKMPFVKIGALFSRNHSTVMTSVKQIQKALDTKNQDLMSSLVTIQQQF